MTTSSKRARSESPGQDRTIRILMAIVEDLTVERDAEGLLRSTLEHVVKMLDLKGGMALVLGPDGNLELIAEYPKGGVDVGTIRELAARALEARRPLVEPLDGGGSLAAAPLCARDRQIGVLIFEDRSGQVLAREMALLEAIAKQITTGLDNARLYAELRETNSRAQVLNRITTTLTTSLELKAVIPAFASEMRTLVPFDLLACSFVNESADYVEVFTHPEQTPWGLGSVLPIVGSGLGSVVLNNHHVLERDLLDNHRFIEDMRLLEDGIRSYLLLPLKARGHSTGAMAFGSSRPGTYDEDTIHLLQPLVDAAALALENVRLFQKTRELTITDDLTPLYNARFFHQILDRELRMADRYGSELSLVFMDLDRFKPINDQYGHLRGSRALREVGFLLRAAVRETDYPVRYGGDEFVIILPLTTASAALLLAEKLRALIEKHVFLQEEDINARIGCSLGVATYPGDAREKEPLIRLADQRMYADKELRKNR